MARTIEYQHKRTDSEVYPDPELVLLGEIAINFFNNTIFTTNPDGETVVLGGSSEGDTVVNEEFLGENYVSKTGDSVISGNLTAFSFNTSSLRELKENIVKFEKSATEILNATEVVSFNFKEDKKKTSIIGFIADDTAPELSGENQDHFEVTNTIGVLIKGFQELHARISVIEEKLSKLEGI